MYPDLLGIFNIQLYGTLFERILWILAALLMIWGVGSSIMLFRKGNKTEALVQGGIVTVLLVWFGYNIYDSFQPDYVLMFKEPLILHSYAFMILVGVGLGTFTAMKMAPRKNFKPIDIAKLCLMMVLFGFIGARAAHVIVEFSTYWNSCFNPAAEGLAKPNCLRWLNVSEGGLTFYGGVIAGIVVLIVFYCKHRKENPDMLALGDLLAPALAMAHGCGRIGCLAAGCCWGAITTGHIGVRYGADSFAFAELAKYPELNAELMISGKTPLLHATQLYEAFGEFILYGILWLLLFKTKRNGTMLATWFISYGVLRFFVEIMRDDTERGHFFESAIPGVNSFFHVAPDHATILSTSQGIAIAMILLGIAITIVSKFHKSAQNA